MKGVFKMSEYQWCPYCKRASKRRSNDSRMLCYERKKKIGEFKVDEVCPFDGCEKGWCEMVPWDYLRMKKKDLPEIPEEGKRYSIKGFRGWYS